MVRVSTSAQHKKLHASKNRRQGVLAALLATVALCSTGCTVFDNIGNSFRYNQTWNDAATKMRHRNLSSKSWHLQKHQYCNEACLDDFCAGYRQGFEDVAGGGTGCTPNFPPRDYWGWQHQTAEGQKKVSAWFAGYPHGARAAEEAGVGNWSQIQMSSNLQAQYVRSGMLPNRGHAVYPITEGTPGQIGGPSAAPAPAGNAAPMGVPNSAQVTPVPMQTQSYMPGPSPVTSSIVNGSYGPNS